jgi:hypothetical protein
MSSTLVTPLLIVEPFGNSAANPANINIPILVPDQTGITVNRASFETGFPVSTMTPEVSGGLPFFGQDMNGILYMISAYCANFAAGALSGYNSTLSTAVSGYPENAVLVAAQSAGAFSLWAQIGASGNTTDPDTGGAGWLPFGGVGSTSVALSNTNVTLTALQAALPFIQFTGNLTGNVVVTFPVNTGQQWIVANATTGAFTLNVQTSGGTPIPVPQTGSAAPTSVYCDGTNIQNTGVSTAGLAPINNPTLTGTPAAPTAAASTSTTQIATTAMVQAAIAAALAGYAPLASPTLSGVPTAPTAAPGTSNAQIATTAFVQAVNNLFKGGHTSAMPGGTAFVTVTYTTPFPTATDGVSVSAAPTAGALIVRDYTGTGVPTDPRGFQVASEAAGIFVSWVAVGH